MHVSIATLIELAKQGSPEAHAALRSYSRMVVADPKGMTIRTFVSEGNFYTVTEKRQGFTWHDSCPREPAPMSIRGIDND